MYHKLQRMREADDRNRKAAKYAVFGFVGLIAVFGLWLLGVFAGQWPMGFGFRYEQWSSEPENLYGISGWRTGPTFGLNTFYFTRGQRIYIDYDATIYTGTFVVRLYRIGKKGLPEVTSRRITKSGSGRVEGTIPEDGFYSFAHYASLDSRSGTGAHEAEYSFYWGIIP